MLGIVNVMINLNINKIKITMIPKEQRFVHCSNGAEVCSKIFDWTLEGYIVHQVIPCNDSKGYFVLLYKY